MGPGRQRGSFRLVVNELYYNATEPSSSGFTFDEDALMNALVSIYSHKINPATDIEQNLFRETVRAINKAVGKGVAESNAPTPDDGFMQALRHSNEVFSAFKVHRASRDMAALLLDSNGNLKPFEQWRQEVEPIANHQCRAWLQTEYDTAVIRAHQAADWQQFEQERDVLPNLKWMPSTSAHPGADHRVFWGTVRPIDDQFWNEHRPGDRWNCKCSLSSTDEPATPVPTGETASNPQNGLKGNPGTEKAVFSQDHPYFPSDCRHCDFYKPGLKARLQTVFHNRKKDCYNCPYINGCIERISSNGFKLERQFDNGGALYIHPGADKKKPDYKPILNICRQMAKEGHTVRITPPLHFKSEEYAQIYASLIGTKYDRKCPDFEVDGKFYEFEGYVKPWSKKKVGRMISHGLAQSSRIVIDNTKGCSDRYLKKQVMARAKLQGQEVNEVWIYEKGKIRLFYKDGKFH